MASYDRDNKRKINERFSLVNIQCPIPDFLLRLDLIGVLAGAETTNIEVFVRQVWAKLFPAVVFSSELERECLLYYEDYRLGFKLMAKGEAIQKPMMILKTLIPVTILSLIDQYGVAEIKLEKLSKDVIDIIRPVLNNESAVVNRTTEVLQQYFDGDTVLSMETVFAIKQYRDFISIIFEKLCTNLSAGKSDRKVKTRVIDNSTGNRVTCSNSYRESCHNTPLNYIRVVCLLYLALEEHRRTGESRESLLKAQWSKVFGTIPFDEAAQNEIDNLIASEPDLDAIDMLFRYSLREIRNGRIVRRIIVGLCVHQVLSRLPHGLSVDMAIDEATTLFSRFTALSVGKEEADIEKYLERFIAIDGNVDDRVSRLLWEYADNISEFFKMSLESINSADSARQRFWWEEILDKKDREVSTLQSQIGATKTNTVFSLVEKLSSSSYNYVLSRLYRFAQGYDSPSEDEIRIAIKTLMQVLHLFGVRTIGEELIDLELSDNACDEVGVMTAVISDMKSNRVVFPGWSVAGDTVVLPIACEKSEVEVL